MPTTTTAPATVTQLRATLAAAEQRRAAANDEVDDANDELDDVWEIIDEASPASKAALERLAAANVEVDAAQVALADARAALSAAYDALDATAAGVRPSICAGRAWDVDVTLLDVDGSVVAEGEVTLVVGERDGRPSSWGELDHWVSDSLRPCLAGHRALVDCVEYVAREAIEASGVPASPEYEG